MSEDLVLVKDRHQLTIDGDNEVLLPEMHKDMVY